METTASTSHLAELPTMRSLCTWSMILAVALALIGIAAEGTTDESEEDKVFDADFGPATIDVSTYPPDQQELYTLYARKCSKCHTLARSINSEYRGDDWKRYVARMSRKPNSGISPRTGEKILQFLKFHFEQADTEGS